MLIEWAYIVFNIEKHKALNMKGGGTLVAWGCLYFSFHQKWSKLGTDTHLGPQFTIMKKKFKIFKIPLKGSVA